VVNEALPETETSARSIAIGWACSPSSNLGIFRSVSAASASLCRGIPASRRQTGRHVCCLSGPLPEARMICCFDAAPQASALTRAAFRGSG